MELVLGLVILGIVTIAIILIMLARGWRPDIDDEKEALKHVPGPVVKVVFGIPFILFGYALWAMGMNKKTATWVAICFAYLAIGAIWFWLYKKRKKKIKKLESELIKELRKELTNKPKDERKE